jgi:hypothetical protein
VSKQLEVGIGADAGAFDKGIRSGVIAPVEDAIKALEDLGRSDGPEDLERSLEDAQRETERLADETRETAREIERQYRDAYDSADRSSRTTLDGMSTRSAEVGGELRQNLGETFSSFRGDLEDLPQIAQDTLGGLAGSGALGGIPGLVATAAGAAGIGLLIGVFQNLGREQEELKKKTQEWAAQYIESGGTVLSTATIVAKGQDILNNEFDTAKANAETWGVSIETAVAAMAGSQSALDTVTTSVRNLREEYETTAGSEAAVDAQGNINAGLYEQSSRLADAESKLGTLTGAMEAGAAQAGIYSAFLRDLAANTAGATTEVVDLGDQIVTLPDGTKIYIDAETGQATTNVDAIEDRIYALPTRKDVWINVNVDDSGWINWTPQLKNGYVTARPTGPLGGPYWE